MTQPLKWHGGKNYLAEWIISHFPPHLHYVECYFGGGAVLFQKPDHWIEGHSEVVNDVNGELMNFWRVLRDNGTQLMNLLLLTPFSSEEFKLSKSVCDHDPVRRAMWFFIRYRQSRQGLGKDFATLTRNRVRRGMNEQVSAWQTAVDGLLDAQARLQRVVILNDDALTVIRQQDGPNTFFYLDPPYLQSTRVSSSAYEYEMTDSDHKRLLTLLGSVKGKFLLSGYRSVLYDRAARTYGWVREERKIDAKSSSKRTKDKRTECLWKNF